MYERKKKVYGGKLNKIWEPKIAKNKLHRTESQSEQQKDFSMKISLQENNKKHDCAVASEIVKLWLKDLRIICFLAC